MRDTDTIALACANDEATKLQSELRAREEEVAALTRERDEAVALASTEAERFRKARDEIGRLHGLLGTLSDENAAMNAVMRVRVDELQRRALALLWRRVSFNPKNCGFTMSRKDHMRLTDRRRWFGDGYECTDVLHELTRNYRHSWIEPLLRALILGDREYLERWCEGGFETVDQAHLSPSELVAELTRWSRSPWPARFPNGGQNERVDGKVVVLRSNSVTGCDYQVFSDGSDNSGGGSWDTELRCSTLRAGRRYDLDQTGAFVEKEHGFWDAVIDWQLKARS